MCSVHSDLLASMKAAASTLLSQEKICSCSTSHSSNTSDSGCKPVQTDALATLLVWRPRLARTGCIGAVIELDQMVFLDVGRPRCAGSCARNGSPTLSACLTGDLPRCGRAEARFASDMPPPNHVLVVAGEQLLRGGMEGEDARDDAAVDATGGGTFATLPVARSAAC